MLVFFPLKLVIDVNRNNKLILQQINYRIHDVVLILGMY